MQQVTQSLADFLLARLADDEAVARNAAASLSDLDCWAAVGSDAISIRKYETGAHIARHDPARVLAEVEAKRRVVDLHVPSGQYDPEEDACILCQWDVDCEAPINNGHPDVATWPCDTLRALASVYRDHPEWREEWA